MEKDTLESVGVDTVAPVEIPSWLATNPSPSAAPAQMSHKTSLRELAYARFEMLFPRIMDRLASGAELSTALGEIDLDLDPGAFRRWIKKDPERLATLKECEELRSEAWADKMVRHALGEYEMEDVQRSKLIVDTYRFRIAADNRRKYGETKTVELGGTISVRAALEAAHNRILEAEILDVTPRLENE